MRAFLNRIINILVVVFFITTGGILTLISISPEWKNFFLSYINPGEKTDCIFLGIAFICVGILIMLTGLKPKRKKDRILSFKNDDGIIQMSSSAISDYIAKLAKEFPSVITMIPEVIPRGNQVDISIVLKVKAGPQIHEICEVMQRRVRETMVNGLGISDVRRVIVNVKDISSEHKSSDV